MPVFPVLWENKWVFLAKTLPAVSHVWWILKWIPSDEQPSLSPSAASENKGLCMIVIQRSCCVCLPKASACNTSVLSPLTPLCRIGLLLLGKPLDRESTDQYRLIVTASDGNPGGVRRNSLLVVLQSWQKSDFSNSLIWKSGSKYQTSTSQKNKWESRNYIDPTCCFREVVLHPNPPCPPVPPFDNQNLSPVLTINPWV